MIKIKHKPESIHARLARSALERYVLSHERLKLVDEPKGLTAPAACFVSLKEGGQLRGCIGSIEPCEKSLAEEIISNAISAGTTDPRFVAVCPEELPFLTYSVDVLSTPGLIESIDGHDPNTHGLIVEGAGKRGLLLPDLEGVDTAEKQLQICYAKAGLDTSVLVKLYRFTVERYF